MAQKEQRRKVELKRYNASRWDAALGIKVKWWPEDYSSKLLPHDPLWNFQHVPRAWLVWLPMTNRLKSQLDGFDHVFSDPGLSDAEMKNVYRRLCLIHHPDKKGTTDAFCRLQRAYNAARLARRTLIDGSHSRPRAAPHSPHSDKAVPNCPVSTCNAKMVQRTNKETGVLFWGCTMFGVIGCKGTRHLTSGPLCPIPSCKAEMNVCQNRSGVLFWGCLMYRTTGCKGTRSMA